MIKTKTIVRQMVNGNIQISENGFLLGEMTKEVFEKHYRSGLKGTIVFEKEKDYQVLTS